MERVGYAYHHGARGDGDATPQWREAVVAEWDSRIGELLAAAADPVEGEEAAVQLAELADASVHAQLLDLLTEVDTAPTAVLALAGYEAPAADVVIKLSREVADLDADVEIRWNGMDALVAWAEPASVTTFRAALAEDDDFVLEPALRGLGLTGDLADVPAILARADEEPEAAVWALSLLVGRRFTSMGTFRAWWAKNRKDETLVERALRKAGAEIDDPDSRVPSLIALLDQTSLPVRWNAFRRLRSITGERFGGRQVVYEGRVQNPESPRGELSVEHVLGSGWTVAYTGGVGFDLNAMGPAMQPMRDSDGRGRWNRALGQWQHWWDAQRDDE